MRRVFIFGEKDSGKSTLYANMTLKEVDVVANNMCQFDVVRIHSLSGKKSLLVWDVASSDQVGGLALSSPHQRERASSLTMPMVLQRGTVIGKDDRIFYVLSAKDIDQALVASESDRGRSITAAVKEILSQYRLTAKNSIVFVINKIDLYHGETATLQQRFDAFIKASGIGALSMIVEFYSNALEDDDCSFASYLLERAYSAQLNLDVKRDVVKKFFTPIMTRYSFVRMYQDQFIRYERFDVNNIKQQKKLACLFFSVIVELWSRDHSHKNDLLFLYNLIESARINPSHHNPYSWLMKERNCLYHGYGKTTTYSCIMDTLATAILLFELEDVPCDRTDSYSSGDDAYYTVGYVYHNKHSRYGFFLYDAISC